MRYFFSGIGGIGMSFLALYAVNTGHEVFGSNNEENERVNYLRDKGINVTIGHKEIPDVDVVIKSTAVKSNNPEIISANEKNIPIMSRMDFLNSVLKSNWSIGVTGTDGKTSTTAMIGHIFKEAGKDPTVFLGGIHDSLEDGNYRRGTGQLISEVDESDGYIIDSVSDVVIVTNLKPDHLEHYDYKFENLEYAVKRYAERARDIVLLNGDDPILLDWKFDVQNVVYFGKSDKCDYKMFNRRTNGAFQEYDIEYKGTYIGTLGLKLPGEHNAYNSLAAVAVAIEYGIDFETIKEAMKSFSPVGRRYNVLYSNSSIVLVDDYAHTPEGLISTINATREFYPDKKVVTIFQPHRYTRLYMHKDEFVDSLEKSDDIKIYRLYAAFEEPIEGVDENKIIEMLKARGKDAKFYSDDNLLIKDLLKEKNAVLLMLGAGDITEVSHNLEKILSRT